MIIMARLFMDNVGWVLGVVDEAKKLGFECLDESKKPKVPHYLERENFKIFNKLIELFNGCVKTLGKVVRNQDLEEYKFFCETVTVHNNMTNTFITETENELEKFRDLKDVLTAYYNESYKVVEKAKERLSKHKIKNIKEIKQVIQLERNMKKAEKNLRQYKSVRRTVKYNALNIANIMTTSTLLHCLVNYTDINDHRTYTGAAGILLNIKEIIEDLLKEDEWKHFHSTKIMKGCLKTLSVKFSKDLKKYNIGIYKFRDMQRREDRGIYPNTDANIVRALCKDFRQAVSNMVDARYQEFKSISYSTKTLEAWINGTQKEMDKLKDGFLSNYKGEIQELASLFADTCFSTTFVMNRDKLKKCINNSVANSFTVSAVLTFVSGLFLSAISISFPPLAFVTFMASTLVTIYLLNVALLSIVAGDVKTGKMVQSAVDINDARNQQPTEKVQQT